MRRVLLIRHGQTDANRLTRAAFGKTGAPLNNLGIRQAQAPKRRLEQKSVNTLTEAIAVPQLLRAQQTAEYAGFKLINTYKILNEIKKANPQATQQLISKRILPGEALLVSLLYE